MPDFDTGMWPKLSCLAFTVGPFAGKDRMRTDIYVETVLL